MSRPDILGWETGTTKVFQPIQISVSVPVALTSERELYENSSTHFGSCAQQQGMGLPKFRQGRVFLACLFFRGSQTFRQGSTSRLPKTCQCNGSAPRPTICLQCDLEICTPSVDLGGLELTCFFRQLPGPKYFDQKFLASFTTVIRSIKYRLIIKLITRMDGNREANLLRLINLSLEVDYCSTHCLIIA